MSEALDLRARRVALAAEIEELKTDRDGLRHIVKKLTDQIEELTEEMFGEANERVAAAERARFMAQMAAAEAEQSRLLTEAEMKRARERIAQLKGRLEEAQTKTQAAAGTSPGSASDPFINKFKRTFITRAGSTGSAEGSDTKPGSNESAGSDRGGRVVDNLLWEEFQGLMAVRSNVGEVVRTTFYQRCLEEDIMPCFNDANITAHTTELLALMVANDLVMESLPAPEPGPCFLSGSEEPLTYRIKSARETNSPLNEWQRISTGSYARMVAVADLHTYLRHLAKGIVRTAEDEVYAELARYRLAITCARLGWTSPLPL